MRVVFQRTDYVFNGQHRTNITREVEESNPDKIKEFLNGDYRVRFVDDGKPPFFHLMRRTFNDHLSDEFYHELLAKGAEGYRLFHQDQKQIVLIRESDAR
jgi:hypothetical protein